jgi:lipoyl(octanoyl) transferase
MGLLQIRRLGVVRYADGLDLQQGLVERRRAGEIPDQLLLLQHPHVLTVGVKKENGRSHILATGDRLDELGVEVHETGRGGDVTYHGPGQIVGYPILDLRPDQCDVHRYVRDLEEVMIRVTGDFGVAAGRIAGLTGVWVGREKPEKIGAIGVRIARWVTCHGFAYNVNVDLEYFNLIVPCGIQNRGVTSLQQVLGGALPLEQVETALVRHFCDVFDREPLGTSQKILGSSWPSRGINGATLVF